MTKFRLVPLKRKRQGISNRTGKAIGLALIGTGVIGAIAIAIGLIGCSPQVECGGNYSYDVVTNDCIKKPGK
jgi:hypothetical protein